MKISKQYILLFLILMLLFLGNINEVMTIISFILTIIVSLILGISYKNKPEYTACVIIMLLLTFQNLFIGIGAHIFENTSESLKFLTQIPFLTIAMLWFPTFIKSSIKEHRKFLLLIFSIVISIFIGHGSMQAILINIRNLTVFYMVYCIAKNNISSKEDYQKLLKNLEKITILLFICGIILIFGGFELYENIGIREVYIAKGAPIQGEELDNRFYTSLVSKKLLRMGSIYYEPVNLAYFFSCALIVLFIEKKWKVTTIIALLGLVLTFGKGGYLLVLSVILCVILFNILDKILKKTKKKKIYLLTSIIAVTFVTIFCIFYYKNIGAAANPHFWGIIRTWKNIMSRPIGYGLGTGGNSAQIFNENASSWLDTGGETALMSFTYQIGIQGIILFLTAVLSTRPSLNEMINKKYLSYYFLPLVLIGISLLQDNTFTPQCIAAFMIFQGAIHSILIKKESKI